ncbi:Serine carboxypeptidase-like [Trametes pubescens]|uniref:Serine carboxypeptidase-like n=1 Tax=Trametes pubescens TaxID=154538 RepID=A0A1M2V6D4_TRAPU|nr:Serine carboxypeptidase-like [Trametes pubescens]
MEAADDIAVFMAIFFEHALHLAGESYGVRPLRSRTWDTGFTLQLRDCVRIKQLVGLLYVNYSHIRDFLSSKRTQELLGVDSSMMRTNFSWDSPDVQEAFRSNLDHFGFPAQYYIGALLERGVRALIYVGATDFICNWIGNERMTLALEWTGQEEFRADTLREWTVDGQAAGVVRSGGGLTYATIAGAGHMVPYDKPVESLELANRWLAGVPL